MASNKPLALARLSEISGVPEETLRRNVAVPLGDRAYDLRGEIVTAEFLSSPKIVYCPACLHDDDKAGARRSRWHWSLAVVRTCPVHEIALQHRKKSAWNDHLQPLYHVVPEKGEELMILATAAAHRAPSPLQNYGLARLEGEQGPECWMRRPWIRLSGRRNCWAYCLRSDRRKLCRNCREMIGIRRILSPEAQYRYRVGTRGSSPGGGVARSP